MALQRGMGLVKERRGKSREAGTIGASPSGGFETSTTIVAYIYNITSSQVKATRTANFFLKSDENVLLNWITFFHFFLDNCYLGHGHNIILLCSI